MSFGRMPMANGFLKKKYFNKEFFYNLEVGFCNKNYLFQINDHPKSPKIFSNNYPFFTSQSKYMTEHFKKYFFWLKKNKYINEYSNCIEIGSNDGTFLKNFKENKIKCTGFEPAKNLVKHKNNKGLNVVNKFFSYKNVSNNKNNKFKIDLICAANVICHIPNLNDLIKAIDFLLAKDGYFVFEEPYLGAMFKKVSYDQIYDAHIYMFSVHSVKKIFEERGFVLVDAIPQITHGGSMRYIVARKSNNKVIKNLNKIIRLERKQKLNSLKSCLNFKKKCIKSKNSFFKKISNFKKKGLKICGYAASAKSTTVLNYCKLSNNQIDYIADSTKEKVGKYTPGSHIPVVSIDHFRKNPPDVAIIFSWNHKKEIISKEKRFKNKKKLWVSHVKNV